MKRQIVRWMRGLDTQWKRTRNPGRRRVLVNAGLPMEFGMIAPIYRRLNNFIASGAIEADSPVARLVGMPKADSLVDGSLRRDEILQSLALDPARPTVLYAPTWTPYSSLNAMGEGVVTQLANAGFCVIVKLHDNSRDPDPRNSGGD